MVYTSRVGFSGVEGNVCLQSVLRVVYSVLFALAATDLVGDNYLYIQEFQMVDHGVILD